MEGKLSRVLVTGGMGFLGKSVCRTLSHRDINYKIFPSQFYDLRIRQQCRDLLLRVNPDIIIHLAARVGGIGANAANPASFFYDNMMMGMNVIDEASRLDIRKVVLVGTVCSYPSETPSPFSEKNLWSGYPEPTNAPYGIAKKALGVMLDAYHRQHGLECAYLIPANLYGPGDTFDESKSHVIPALIAKFVVAKEKSLDEVVIWGDGEPTREFLYVDDAAEAIVEATFKVNDSAPINLGSGHATNIRTLALMIAELTDYNGRVVFDTSKPNGQMQRTIDSTRAFGLLKWRPKVDLKKGLMETIKRFQERHSW